MNFKENTPGHGDNTKKRSPCNRKLVHSCRRQQKLKERGTQILPQGNTTNVYLHHLKHHDEQIDKSCLKVKSENVD